jgi:hypothetical protein
MSIWAPVVAALGSSLLTGGAAFGTIWWQERQRRTVDVLAGRDGAYLQLISSSLSFLIRARTLRDAMRARSGLGEGIDVALRIRQPLDAFSFHDWFSQGFDPVNQAWSKVELIGSPEAVNAATELMDACADLVAVAGSYGSARGRLGTAFRGIEWTAEEQEALQAEVERLVSCRTAFIRIARQEGGRTVIAPNDLAEELAACDDP